MNLEKYQEKADYILKKEEEMSFKEFAEGLLNYSFQKGFENELNKLARWEVDNKELDDYLIKRNIQKEFDLGYRSYIGDFFLSDRVNFLEKRAEEFGLELDEEYEIKAFKTEELEKEFAELKKYDDDDYYGEFFNAYEFNCSATIFNFIKKYYDEIEESIKNLPHECERKDHILKEDFEKMLKEKYLKENSYFKEKAEFIKEFTSDFMDDRTEKIKKGEIKKGKIGDYHDKEKLKKEVEKLGFNIKSFESYAYELVEKYFDEKGISKSEKYKKEIYNIYNKEKEKNKEKD